jgi:hypothetical protein
MCKSVAAWKIVTLLPLAVMCANCGKDSASVSAKQTRSQEELNMAESNALEALLNAQNWAAVEMAQKQGPAALPVVKRAAGAAKYQTRQIAMACAGKIGGGESARILAAGLADSDLNVRLAAANELVVNPPQEAAGAIVGRLAVEPDDRVKESLAMAAGYIPGGATIQVLRRVAAGTGSVALTSRMALAKLGDASAREIVTAELTSPNPTARYTALAWLRYIDDKVFVAQARKLLYDKMNAQMIGPERAPRFRRVCDQAVDTLVALLKLKAPFETNLEKIYSDAEINTVAKMVP